VTLRGLFDLLPYADCKAESGQPKEVILATFCARSGPRPRKHYRLKQSDEKPKDDASRDVLDGECEVLGKMAVGMPRCRDRI
jgi:hypothetical protein